MPTFSVSSDRQLPSTWNRWCLVTNSQGYSLPNDHAIFEWYFPANRFTFVNEISDNRLAIPSGLDEMVFIGAPIAFNMVRPIVEIFKLSRKYSYGGGDGGYWPINQYIRCGFHVGNTFKMQCYVTCVGVVSGLSSTFQGMIWSEAGCSSVVDYYSNCRLRQLYVKYGKILSIRPAEPLSAQQETSTVRDMWMKIVEDTTGLKDGTTPTSASITVWSKQVKSTLEESLLISAGKAVPWVSVVLPIKEINEFGEARVTVKDVQNSYVRTGDFFEIDTPLIVNDPNLLYEYSLGLRNGKIGTKAQLFQLPGNEYKGLKVIGVWVGGTEKEQKVTKASGDDMLEKFFVYTPYADSGDRQAIRIPANANEMYRRKEDQEFGGSFSDGLTKLKDSNAQSIRVQLNWSGGNVSQNFSANCLAGQFAKIGDSMFEILDNPRSDVIELSMRSINGDVKLLDVLKSGVKHEVYQHKYWFFNEFYTLLSGFSTGIYGGNVTSVSPTKAKVNNAEVKALDLKWTATDTRTTEFLTEKEKTDSGCETLLERIKKDSPKVKDGSIEIYKKFKGWKVYNTNTRTSYELLEIKFADEGAPDAQGAVRYDVTAKILADNQTEFEAAPVCVVLGEPFDVLVGDRANQAAVFIQAFVELAEGSAGLYNLWLTGPMDLGYYQFDSVLESNNRISLVDTSFGLKIGYSFVPGLHVSTYKRALLFCSAYETNLVDYKHILYKHSQYGILADRYYKYYMKNERLVRFGPPLSLDKIKPSDYNRLIATGARADIAKPTPVKTDKDTKTEYYPSYWIKLPQKQKGMNNTFYFASPINGIGGVETILTRRDGVRLLPASVTAATTAGGTPTTTGSLKQEGVLPFEISSPSPAGSDVQSVYVPFYYVAADNESLVSDMGKGKFGLVPTEGKIDQLNTLLNNGVVSGDAPDASVACAVEVTPIDNMPLDHSYAKVLPLGNGGMVLATSAKWPAGSLVDGDKDNPFVQDKYAACLMVSKNNGGYWRSPRYDINTKDEMEKSIYLLGLISDFYLIDAVLDEIDNEIYLFGYLSEKSSEAELQKTRDRNGKYNKYNDVITRDVCLAMYKFPLSHCYQQQMDKLKKIEFKGVTVSYYLPPTAKIFTFDPEPDPATMPLDHCTRIMSKEALDSTAAIVSSIAAFFENKKLTQNDVFSVVRSAGGIIRIYMQDAYHDGIICLSSGDSGFTWSVFTKDVYSSASPPPKKLEELNPVIYAAKGTHPFVLDKYLFYFKDKQDLYMKNIMLEGSGPKMQELLDSTGEILIAEGIPPQRVSGLISNDSTSIYYIDANGNLKAIESKDNGATWLPPVNW